MFSRTDEYGNKKSLGKKIGVALLVLGGVLLIFLTTFYNDLSFTGRSIETITSDNSIDVSLQVNIPELELDGDYDIIKITGNSQLFYIGNEKVSLDGSIENEVILEGYSGKISFNTGSIYLLDGKASKVTLNGLPISDREDKKITVKTESDFYYQTLEFSNQLYLKQLSYEATGDVKLDEQTSIALSGDQITLNDFLGKMKIEEKQMFLEGLTENLEINSNNKKITVSKS